MHFLNNHPYNLRLIPVCCFSVFASWPGSAILSGKAISKKVRAKSGTDYRIT
jgi:hypothetical protein